MQKQPVSTTAFSSIKIFKLKEISDFIINFIDWVFNNREKTTREKLEILIRECQDILILFQYFSKTDQIATSVLVNEHEQEPNKKSAFWESRPNMVQFAKNIHPDVFDSLNNEKINNTLKTIKQKLNQEIPPVDNTRELEPFLNQNGFPKDYPIDIFKAFTTDSLFVTGCESSAYKEKILRNLRVTLLHSNNTSVKI